jgi:cellulose biosynthesis protein BcsQ
MGKIISVFSHKGGVGKTTFVYNLGVSLAKKGKKVLFIDADSQMNLSSYVFGKSTNISYGNGNDDIDEKMLNEQEEAQEKLNDDWKTFMEKYRSFIEHIDCYQENMTKVIEKEKIEHKKPLYQHDKYKENIHLLRGEVGEAFLEAEFSWIEILGDKLGKKSNDLSPYLFEKAIRDFVDIKNKDKYDYVLIDTPPSSSTMMSAALVLVSDYFIFPTTPSFFSLQSVNNLSDIFKNWRQRFDKYQSTGNKFGMSLKPKFLGIIVQKSRRYSRDNKNKNQYSKATQNWATKINKKLDDFYESYAIDRGLALPRSDFKNYFPDRSPFIIDYIADFTLVLSTKAEECGKSILDIQDSDFDTFKTLKNGKPGKTAGKIPAGALKAQESVKDSYEYISTCIEKLP